MNQFSDSESHDSDEGIRFKTENIRDKHEKNLSSSRHRSRSRSPKHRDKYRKERKSSSDDSTSEMKPEEDLVMGPALPPHLLKKPVENEMFKESSGIGPLLPTHLLKKEETIGPVLPPHMLQKHESIGPELPPHMLKSDEETSDVGSQVPRNEEKATIGPQLPPHLRQKLQEAAEAEVSEDEEIYGPLPVGTSNFSKAQMELEERALRLKMGQLEPSTDKQPVREEWMLELPEVKAEKFGLGPRQFRSKAGPDMSDRSSWTDTPDKKNKKIEKIDLKKEAELKEIRKRDEEQERMSKKHKKKNKESLVEIHQSKMAKKKEEEPKERRPFSRDIDLQVNRFDEAQKKAVLKKAQLLDDRFSSGQSKFL